MNRVGISAERPGEAPASVAELEVGRSGKSLPWVGLAFSTVAALALSSCVSPACWKHVYPGFTAGKKQSFAVLDILSEPFTDSDPLAGPRARSARRYGLGVWFGHNATIRVDDRGGLFTMDRSSLPEGCVTVPADELAAVSRSWAPVLEPAGSGPMELHRLRRPFTGADWRPYGPLVSLSFGPPESGFGLLWDGEASLPEDLDVAVMRTLEMICSNGRKARRILLRDLPQQVVARLECRIR